ncbi:DUF4235 domain-containing protein [Saxibacter everestensis]|uniref:DUF4235 domain-containing protein n=1 Tax=Saxibacter everestensis TaxID=2909229 RepID=A0ABY8QSR5_9MICO|nr:DUF4235 domain-containing protein [Brevibacteriaceae bacterium ZFBP1038]
MFYKVFGSVGAVLAGIVAKRLVTVIWEKSLGKAAPSDVRNPDIGTREAVGWAIASGVSIAVAQLLVQRGAANVLRKRHGDAKLPKALRKVLDEAN